MILARFPGQYAVIWLLQIGAVIITWNYLPTSAVRTLLVGLVVASNLLALRGYKDLAILTSIALFISLALLWLSNGFVSQTTGAVVVFAGVILTGLLLAAEKGAIGPSNTFPYWLILGFSGAEIVSLAALWPADFFQKTALCVVMFYFLWQLGVHLYGLARSSLASHFGYSVLAVIVVIGSIFASTR